MLHDGLFVKLFDLGIRSKLLGIIIDLHTNMRSCVLFKEHKSAWFKILWVVLFPLLCFFVLTTTYLNNWLIVMSDSKC